MTDLEKIPVAALRFASVDLISGRLNPHRVIPTDEGIPRDWRGLAHLIGVNATDTERIGSFPNPTEKLIKQWTQGNLKKLQEFLETLDRFDVVDDSQKLLEKDIEVYLTPTVVSEQQSTLVPRSDSSVLTVHDVSRAAEGLGPQIYDAFLLFADEDVDFAMEIVNKMEQEHNMTICLRDHLVGGVTFEHDAVTKLIAERCRRLLVVISPAFLESPSNKFAVTFAQAIGIDRQERKLIPIIYKKCLMPPELSYYFSLKYYLNLPWDFWDTLRKSILTSEVSTVSASSSPWMSHRSPPVPQNSKLISSSPGTPSQAISSPAESSDQKNPVDIETPPTKKSSSDGKTSDSAKHPISKAYNFIANLAKKDDSAEKSTNEKEKKKKKGIFGKKKAVALVVGE